MESAREGQECDSVRVLRAYIREDTAIDTLCHTLKMAENKLVFGTDFPDADWMSLVGRTFKKITWDPIHDPVEGFPFWIYGRVLSVDMESQLFRVLLMTMGINNEVLSFSKQFMPFKLWAVCHEITIEQFDEKFKEAFTFFNFK